MKDNDWVYKQLEGEFGIDWRVCREIMENNARLIAKEISSDESWGCINLGAMGKFDTKHHIKNKHKDNDLVLTPNGFMPIAQARKKRKYNLTKNRRKNEHGEPGPCIQAEEA